MKNYLLCAHFLGLAVLIGWAAPANAQVTYQIETDNNPSNIQMGHTGSGPLYQPNPFVNANGNGWELFVRRNVPTGPFYPSTLGSAMTLVTFKFKIIANGGTPTYADWTTGQIGHAYVALTGRGGYNAATGFSAGAGGTGFAAAASVTAAPNMWVYPVNGSLIDTLSPAQVTGRSVFYLDSKGRWVADGVTDATVSFQNLLSAFPPGAQGGDWIESKTKIFIKLVNGYSLPVP